jgi:hypothetical protein
VRDLLGHASIVTTERYDNQKPEALMAAAKRLETGESFKIVSSLPLRPASEAVPARRSESRKFFEGSKNEVGVSDGVRTRDFRSHSPALYH